MANSSGDSRVPLAADLLLGSRGLETEGETKVDGNAQSRLEYWREHLVGAPRLELPSDYSTSSPRTPAEAHYSFSLPAELTSQLVEFCKTHGLAPAIPLLSCFEVLLARYSRQVDFVIAASGMDHPSGVGVGYGALHPGPIFLRAGLGGQPSFRELVGRVAASLTKAREQNELPFDRVVAELTAHSDLSSQRTFPIGFTVGPAVEHSWTGRQHALARPGGVNLVRYGLVLSLQLQSKLWIGTLQYSVASFDAATIERLSTHFAVLLASLLAEPDHCIWKTPLMSSGERSKVLFEWNQTQASFPEAPNYAAEFERQAALDPEAVAVVAGDTFLSYGQLNRRANGLALQLQHLGVGPEVLVGVCMRRHLDMAVLLLAIFKAGGAYLPLDPSYPTDHLNRLINDAKPLLIVGHRPSIAVLPPHSSGILCVDDDSVRSAIEALASAVNPVSRATPDTLAYVIYTSGSTGKPNGVEITHRALLNHNHAIACAYDLRAGDRALQFASLNFDIAVEEFFPSWLAGATVVLRDDESISSLQRFFEFVAQARITVLNLPTAFWHAMVREMGDYALPSTVTRVIIGGEACSPARAAEWLERVKHPVRLINAYGPTETTVTATLFTIERLRAKAKVPIGRPIANVVAYVLDSNLEPVPIGVPGDLYLGGVGLARGYRNAPEITAERFVANPFCSLPHARMYKTGDQARWLPDGNLEYLGRADSQIKIRGYRVELGEIESRLQSHSMVQSAVVVKVDHDESEPQLIAYYVTSNPSDIGSELKEWCLKSLPHFMVPSHFVAVPELPLMPNGKINLRALSQLPTPAQQVFPSAQLPKSSLERVLIQLWSEILCVEPPRVSDNFFSLGGSSLSAIRLISRLFELFEMELDVKALFQSPTIEGLARELRQGETRSGEAEERAALILEVASLSGADVDYYLGAPEARKVD